MDLYISSVAQKDKVTPTNEDMLRSRRLPLSEESQLFFSPHKSTFRARFYEQKLRFIIKMTGSRLLRGDKMPAMIHEPIDELLNLMEDHTEDDHER